MSLIINNFNVGTKNVAETFIGLSPREAKATHTDSLLLEKTLFISHSSKDTEIVNPFVEMLLDAGFPKRNLFYSSNPDLGVPVGEDIYDCLHRKLTEDTFVIFMLSSNWCGSSICENEMGAAWHGNLKHCNVFLPGFSNRAISDVASSSEMAIMYNEGISILRDKLGQLRRQLEKHFDLQLADSEWEKSRERFLTAIK